MLAAAAILRALAFSVMQSHRYHHIVEHSGLIERDATNLPKHQVLGLTAPSSLSGQHSAFTATQPVPTLVLEHGTGQPRIKAINNLA